MNKSLKLTVISFYELFSLTANGSAMLNSTGAYKLQNCNIIYNVNNTSSLKYTNCIENIQRHKLVIILTEISFCEIHENHV